MGSACFGGRNNWIVLVFLHKYILAQNLLPTISKCNWSRIKHTKTFQYKRMVTCLYCGEMGSKGCMVVMIMPLQFTSITLVLLYFTQIWPSQMGSNMLLFYLQLITRTHPIQFNPLASFYCKSKPFLQYSQQRTFHNINTHCTKQGILSCQH
jgi:hypothetical protein